MAADVSIETKIPFNEETTLNAWWVGLGSLTTFAAGGGLQRYLINRDMKEINPDASVKTVSKAAKVSRNRKRLALKGGA